MSLDLFAFLLWWAYAAGAAVIAVVMVLLYLFSHRDD